ncbi:MAG: polysaccharide deacetylase family protein [Phycisphaeraceae bacterium JB051]
MSLLRFVVLPLLLMSLLMQPLAAQSMDVSVCRFKDDKPAAISLTFDDGLLDAYTVVKPLLTEYGYKGTFYVVTSWADNADKNTRPDRKFMSWDQVKAMADAGHEIGNHSVKHYQLAKAKSMDDVLYEITHPLGIFKDKIGITPQTFCYPGNSRNDQIVQIAHEHHLYSTCFGRQMFGGENYTHQKTVEWVNRTIENKQWSVAMIHAILQGYGWAPFPNDEKDFVAVLDLLKQHDDELWIDTFVNVSKYVKLRDASSLQWIEQDKILMLKTELDSKVYDQPLTVKISKDGQSRYVQMLANTPITLQ